MQLDDFMLENKYYFSTNQDWNYLLLKLKKIKIFFEQLYILTFNQNFKAIHTSNGLVTLDCYCILQSATQTFSSMLLCIEYGNIADSYVLLRKFRDDLFFYLYVLNTCANTKDIGSKDKKYITDWKSNELSNLNISEIIKQITTSRICDDFTKKYEIQAELKKISKTLNNYTYGNGPLYYNRPYSRYRDIELKQHIQELLHLTNYISVTFIFLLILISPICIMSDDYTSYLENDCTAPKGTQYLVAPFVEQFVKENKDFLGKASIEYLRTITNMSI